MYYVLFLYPVLFILYMVLQVVLGVWVRIRVRNR